MEFELEIIILKFLGIFLKISFPLFLNYFCAFKQKQKGRTALHVACAKGALDIVRLLLAYGARADLKLKTKKI